MLGREGCLFSSTERAWVAKPVVEGYPAVGVLQSEGVRWDRPGRSGIGPAEGCLFSLKERGLPRLGFALVEIPDRGRG